MSQINREMKIKKINTANVVIYALLAAIAMAAYMVWNYISYGQWFLDSSMQGLMKAIRTPWLDAVFRALTATGETLPVIIVTALLIIVLFIYKKHMEAIMVAIYMLGVWRFNELLKVLIHRPRPDVSLHLVDIGHYNEANSFSMPSGHSMNLMALVLLSIYLIWIFSKNKKFNIGATVVLLLYGLLTGLSRVYLNVHYISDIITGWSLSIAWISAAVILYRLLCTRVNKYNP